MDAEPLPKLKRQPKGPRPGFEITGDYKMETVAAIPYDIIKEGVVA